MGWSTPQKFDDDYVHTWWIVVEYNPERSLFQLKIKMEVWVLGIIITTSSVDRSLDEYAYTTMKVIAQQTECDWLDGKANKLLSYTGWARKEFHPQLTRSHFNNYLKKSSSKLWESRILKLSPFLLMLLIHWRTIVVHLTPAHSARHLRPYNPFSNLIEEISSKCKFTFKKCPAEYRDDSSNVHEGITVKNHHYQLLDDGRHVSFRIISSFNNASYDHHSLTFIEVLLERRVCLIAVFQNSVQNFLCRFVDRFLLDLRVRSGD